MPFDPRDPAQREELKRLVTSSHPGPWPIAAATVFIDEMRQVLPAFLEEVEDRGRKLKKVEAVAKRGGSALGDGFLWKDPQGHRYCDRCSAKEKDEKHAPDCDIGHAVRAFKELVWTAWLNETPATPAKE